MRTTFSLRSLGGALLIAASLIGSGAAVAQDSAAAITVYLEGHFVGALTKRINEEHAKQAALGYTFAALESHTENGDLEGVWLTYVRR